MRLKFWPVALVAAAALVSGWRTDALAQSYPERPVRMLIAFPGGGTIDTLGRILAQKLTEAWGQNVVIENRPGAGGNRRRGGGEVCARRLYAAFRRANARRQRDAAAEQGVRSGQGLRPHHAG